MYKISLWLISILFAVYSLAANSSCDIAALIGKNQSALACYILEPENIAHPWVFNNKQYDSDRKVSITSYVLSSQTWPKTTMSTHGTVWQHALVIYQPDIVNTDQALLFVSGGMRASTDRLPLPHQLDFARIAAETDSIVVELQDIPNQSLTFDDNVERKEDGIVAYTWQRYMDNPESGLYWPLHLPMTKSVIKAMDAVQQIIDAQNSPIHVKNFVVTGASKRGLTTWLAALSDERINAIVPIVIDILNTKDNINLIHDSYQKNNNINIIHDGDNSAWPAALGDYVAAGVTARLKSDEFTQLMKIEDPISYLNCQGCDFYKKRLEIPKYIISASGDDFFVPDSLNLYLDKLPGETQVRVMPNQRHYIDMKIVEDAILSYYKTIIAQASRPSLTWTVSAAGKIENILTHGQPASVKLWEAENPEVRDFRLASNIHYSSQELSGNCVNDHCQYPVIITSPAKGWKASFVEVTFPQPQGEPLILTTSTYVIGAN